MKTMTRMTFQALLAALLLTGAGQAPAAAETGSETAVAPASEEAAPVARRFRNRLERQSEIRERMDVNGDGTVDETERERAREFMRGKFRDRRQTWMEENPEAAGRMDRNGDGTIDETEWVQARQIRRERFRENTQARAENRSAPAGHFDPQSADTPGRGAWREERKHLRRAGMDGDNERPGRRFRARQGEHAGFSGGPGGGFGPDRTDRPGPASFGR